MMLKKTALVFTALLAVMISCKSGEQVPSEKADELPEGTVLWMDLTRWSEIGTGDSALIERMWDNLHVCATLQGVVNREAPVMYLDYVKTGGVNIDEYWWNKFSTPGGWLAGREVVKTTDPVQACEMLRDRFNGLVVYDPEVPATSCIASMIAGVEDLVAVRYDTSKGSLYTRLTEKGFPVKVWLVEENGNTMFSSKTDVYRWAIDNYLKKGKCNPGYMGYYIDQCWLRNPGVANKNHHLLTNHDFFVSKRAFFFDLSPWSDEVATDDPAGTVGGDFETLKEILLECYRQNGNGETFCHIGGFPAWAYKYTNYGQVGGGHTPVETEWKFAEIIGEYNAFKDADAIDYGALANASFWQYFPLRESYPQAWTSRETLKSKGYLDADGHVDLSKRYIVLYVGDFDAASWISQTAPSIWDDPGRGSVPMMWCVSPVLARRAPQVMHYMWTSASDNDYFAAADNGAGYLNPGSLEIPRAISGLPSGMEQWARHCKPCYEQWDISVTGFIIDGNAKGMSEEGFKAYATFSPNGIVPQKVPSYSGSVDGMPYIQSAGNANYDRPSEAADAIRGAVINHASCPFYWFRAILKTPSWYADLKSTLAQSNPEIVWLGGPEFFELLKCHLENQQ